MFREMLTFLAADGWPVEPDTFDGLPCIRTRFVGTEAAWDCRVRPYDPFGQIAFESILPVAFEPETRGAVTSLIMKVNWRLLTGAFQLDEDSGDVVFRTMLFLQDDVELSEPLCRGLSYSNVLTVERCLAQFLAVAGGADERKAFAELAL